MANPIKVRASYAHDLNYLRRLGMAFEKDELLSTTRRKRLVDGMQAIIAELHAEESERIKETRK